MTGNTASFAMHIFAVLLFVLHSPSAFNPARPGKTVSIGHPVFANSCHVIWHSQRGMDRKNPVAKATDASASSTHLLPTFCKRPSRPSVLPNKDPLPEGQADFSEWLSKRLAAEPMAEQYPELFEKVHACVLRWRKRYYGNRRVWKRLMKGEKVIKEIVEAAPVLAAAHEVVSSAASAEKFTIVDLCSGKGFLSMILSEILPQERIECCVLVDKAWPPRDWEGPIAQHHISHEHIYGLREGANLDGETYFETWPIPLHVKKCDLKRGRSNLRSMKSLIDSSSGPVLLLAVHLCGTLALRAVDLFNDNKKVRLFVLKPCCLPPMVLATQDAQLSIGKYTFPASEVAAPGRFVKRSAWDGPPRNHLIPRFERWTAHLLRGIDLTTSEGAKSLHFCRVQRIGYQNLFIFAERGPQLTSSMWAWLRQSPQEAQEVFQRIADYDETLSSA
mmetsp:Transcript_93161/g.171349  ORF Transcript_93161/g.171349 Transcript_93161/m.171349 type:complete len:445 (+) Transcript_93161:155-1489(+)